MDANENNQNPDTPANQGSETLSVEEAFFTSEEQQAQQEVVGTPTEGTPAGEEAQINTEVAQDKNDERRFQYWQSEADKAKNENAQLRAQVQQMSQAQEDPGSKSAQYLNELDEWRDNIIQYNSLKSDYQAALINEQMQKQEDRRKTAIANQQAYQQQRAQMNEVYNRVQGEYGLSNEEATEFVQTMSSPESLTMDNLVQLYRMQKGSGQTTQPAGPSDTFNQQARAQQVPSPMGVLPAQSNEQNVSQEEQIMDSIISGYKKNNPW